MLIFYEPRRVNIRKYTTFCEEINEDGERMSKQIIYLLTKYIKRVLWGVRHVCPIYRMRGA